jgi:hypothetical protein
MLRSEDDMGAGDCDHLRHFATGVDSLPGRDGIACGEVSEASEGMGRVWLCGINVVLCRRKRWPTCKRELVC